MYTPKIFLRINILRRFLLDKEVDSLLEEYILNKKKDMGDRSKKGKIESKKEKTRVFIDGKEYRIIK